jgi:sirohydrochlorin cobaltochelatase
MTTGVLLVGHGSHLDPNSSAPVHAHAACLRCSGRYAQVHTGFWKEEPSLSRALDAFSCGDVTVVPLFISNGYFTQEVIPSEMGLSGRVSHVGGRCVRYTPPIGDHPALAHVIVERAREASCTGEEALAILGHGTRRNSQSEANVYAQAERVRATGAFPEVATVFLDQDPHMTGVLDLVRARDVVVVPLFIADGWHAGQTIPGDLAATGGPGHGGRTLRYARAVGTHPSVAGVVDELVREAAAW